MWHSFSSHKNHKTTKENFKNEDKMCIEATVCDHNAKKPIN